MSALKAQDKFVTVNRLRLHYLEWGSPGKPAIVCLHGHSGQAHIWDEFAQAMSPHFQVLALDQRGHGESQWASDGYERDRFVEDLAGFADALALKKMVLVGLSMGGLNAILYTPLHQERVDKVILVDIAPEPSQASRQRMTQRPPTPLEFDSFEAAFAWAREGSPLTSEARLRQDLMDRMRQAENGKWRWKADPALFAGTPRDILVPELIARCWQRLEAITCPILLVRGEESQGISQDILDRMKRANPRLNSIAVAGAGHVVPVDKPQGFIAATAPFLGVAI